MYLSQIKDMKFYNHNFFTMKFRRFEKKQVHMIAIFKGEYYKSPCILIASTSDNLGRDSSVVPPVFVLLPSQLWP